MQTGQPMVDAWRGYLEALISSASSQVSSGEVLGFNGHGIFCAGKAGKGVTRPMEGRG